MQTVCSFGLILIFSVTASAYEIDNPTTISLTVKTQDLKIQCISEDILEVKSSELTRYSVAGITSWESYLMTPKICEIVKDYLAQQPSSSIQINAIIRQSKRLVESSGCTPGRDCRFVYEVYDFEYMDLKILDMHLKGGLIIPGSLREVIERLHCSSQARDCDYLHR